MVGKRLTQDEIISKFILVHGNDYDYSNVKYINNKIKVDIKCNKCENVFRQTSNNHLSKHGCPFCANNNISLTNTKSTEDFIKDAIEVHGNKYDYSEVVYIKNINEVIIKCTTCKSKFLQTPKYHLRGYGCTACYNNNNRKTRKKSIGEFIEDAIKVHGNKYDYSEVKYINNYTKVDIKCIRCGNLFPQTPCSHLGGSGCPQCSRIDGKIKRNRHYIIKKPKKSTEDFIKEAIILHDNKYDYSKVVYINPYEKVIIKCNRCNVNFSQTPYSHLNGHGCNKCNIANSKSNEEFIKDAIKVHGNKYDYSKVKYINNNTKVIIKCIRCETIFQQNASRHLEGRGCPTCGKVHKRLRTKTTEQFIKEAKEIHGDKYNYAGVVYIGALKSINIKCNKCNNIFPQKPNDHLKKNNSGCPDCALNEKRSKRKKTNEQFIKEAMEVHGDKYDYSETKYINNKKKVNIKCNKCGNIFLQNTSHHIRGCDCPVCAKYEHTSVLQKRNLDKQMSLYLIKLSNKNENFIKIGISINMPERFASFNRSNYNVNLLKSYTNDGFTIADLEKKFIIKYNYCKYTPKIKFQGHTECFNISLLPQLNLESENWYTV